MRGYSSCLLCIALFRGSYFGIFDTAKQYTENDFQKWMAAYAAGLTAGLSVFPIETIRKKKILSYSKINYTSVFFKTLKNEGVKGFFRGCSLVPVQALCGASVLMYFDSKRKYY